jgi:hypothetical protein
VPNAGEHTARSASGRFCRLSKKGSGWIVGNSEIADAWAPGGQFVSNTNLPFDLENDTIVRAHLARSRLCETIFLSEHSRRSVIRTSTARIAHLAPSATESASGLCGAPPPFEAPVNLPHAVRNIGRSSSHRQSSLPRWGARPTFATSVNSSHAGLRKGHGFRQSTEARCERACGGGPRTARWGEPHVPLGRSLLLAVASSHLLSVRLFQVRSNVARSPQTVLTPHSARYARHPLPRGPRGEGKQLTVRENSPLPWGEGGRRRRPGEGGLLLAALPKNLTEDNHPVSSCNNRISRS